MEVALTIVGALLIGATLISLSRREIWWVRIFDFPRAQILLLLVVTFVAYVSFVTPAGILAWGFVVMLSACILYQVYMIYPYTRLAPKQAQAAAHPRRGATLSLLFANVLMTNRDASRLKDIIRRVDPDVVLALETDRWWQQQLAELERTYPHAVLQPQNNTYGMLLYSKLPLSNSAVEFLVHDDVPSIHTEARLPCGQAVWLHCVHPRPPFVTTSKTSLPRDAELLIIGKHVEKRTLPVVVLGDLNDVAWSRTTCLFQKISRLLDPRIGRGFYNTFHAKYPFLRFPLDHFFHSEDFKLLRFGRLPYFGSDHFPVFIEVSYEPATAEQQAPRADHADRKEAQKKIEKAT